MNTDIGEYHLLGGDGSKVNEESGLNQYLSEYLKKLYIPLVDVILAKSGENNYSKSASEIRAFTHNHRLAKFIATSNIQEVSMILNAYLIYENIRGNEQVHDFVQSFKHFFVTLSEIPLNPDDYAEWANNVVTSADGLMHSSLGLTELGVDIMFFDEEELGVSHMRSLFDS